MKIEALLIGKPVYSIDQGQYLGKVCDAYFDPEFQRLTGVVLDNEGGIAGKAMQLFSRNRDERVITINNIQVRGLDALLLPSAEVLIKTKEGQAMPGNILWSSIRGRTMLGQDMKLATVGDVETDDVLNVIGVTLSKVLVDGKLKAVQLVPRGAIIHHGGPAGGEIEIDIAKV